jgi:hypothetical protein
MTHSKLLNASDLLLSRKNQFFTALPAPASGLRSSPPRSAKNRIRCYRIPLIAKYNAQAPLRDIATAAGIEVFICRVVVGKYKGFSFAPLCDLERALFGERAVRKLLKH